MSSNNHVLKENNKPFSIVQKKSLALISEALGSKFKLTELCKTTSKTIAKVCPCIPFASDIIY